MASLTASAYAPLEYISSCYEVPVRHASFDDSGGKQDGAFIYAGYVAPQPYWEDFNRDWDNALRSYNLTHLHTTDFLASVPIVGGGRKTDDEVFSLLDPFIRVIQHRLVSGEGFGVVAVTASDAWSSLSVREQRLASQPSQVSFETAIGLACGALAPTLSSADPVSIQVDECKDAAVMVSHYLKLKSYPLFRESLGAICFADDEKLRSIQAADMLAHLALRQWRTSKMRKWPDRLTRLIDCNFPESRIKFHDADELRLKASASIR